MLRLTQADRAVAEIGAIAEHVASLTAAAAAFRLRSDFPNSGEEQSEAALLPPLDHEGGNPTLVEIREWSREMLALDGVPAIWRALAHQPRLLDATWRKDRLVLSPGCLDELVKACAALAVAQFRQSEYWICYYTHLLRRRHGFDDRVLVELAGAVMHYVSFNTIAHGMSLDAPATEMTAADVAPGGRFEHVPPGARRRATSA